MFSKSPNYVKLKTNLRLAINRMKLAEKKKAELAQKARKEIADYIQEDKIERAKIRVEQIIREDYLVEALEIVEIYCDQLVARFGLITQLKELDDSIIEAVSSILWAYPILQSDIPEIRIIAEIFEIKYGPNFSKICRDGDSDKISEKLKRKLSIQTPPKALVEKYMVAIAKSYDLIYEPDPEIMKGGKDLIDLSDKSNMIGFIGFPQPPVMSPPHLLPQTSHYNIPQQFNPKEDDKPSTNLDLPNTPSTNSKNDDFDFDALNRRFEELKKLK